MYCVIMIRWVAFPSFDFDTILLLYQMDELMNQRTILVRLIIAVTNTMNGLLDDVQYEGWNKLHYSYLTQQMNPTVKLQQAVNHC